MQQWERSRKQRIVFKAMQKRVQDKVNSHKLDNYLDTFYERGLKRSVFKAFKLFA